MINMFEKVQWVLDNIWGINGDTFVIRKNDSPENIETCNGEAIEDKKTRTCALCVALNDTVFKNYNKPEYYHLNCKCKNGKYNLAKIKIDFPIEKITRYLFVNENKKRMMRKMGYMEEDAQELRAVIKKEVEHNFLSGKYSLNVLNEN